MGRVKCQNDGAFGANILTYYNKHLLTKMATTKWNLSILRKVSDETLTYLVILQAQIVTQTHIGCRNDRAVRANTLSYLTF